MGALYIDNVVLSVKLPPKKQGDSSRDQGDFPKHAGESVKMPVASAQRQEGSVDCPGKRGICPETRGRESSNGGHSCCRTSGILDACIMSTHSSHCICASWQKVTENYQPFKGGYVAQLSFSYARCFGVQVTNSQHPAWYKDSLRAQIII